jgi:hypothetical protein
MDHDHHHDDGPTPITTPIIYLFAVYVAFTQLEATIWMVTLVILASVIILWWSWKNEKKDVEKRKSEGTNFVQNKQYEKYRESYEQWKDEHKSSE